MNCICVIEPDGSLAEMIRRKLRLFSYEVKVITDYAKVDEYIKEYDPDLILMAIDLPLVNGFYWGTKIRKFTSAPIVYLATDNDSINLGYVKAMGGANYVVKPFSINILVKTVNSVLHNVSTKSRYNAADEICGE